jgi:hypothetical protein
VRAVTLPRTFSFGFLPACIGLALQAAPARAETPAPGTISDSSDPTAAALPPPKPPVDSTLPTPGTRWAVLGTGLAVTGVSYGLVVGASYAWPNERNSRELRVPIVGPWMAIANTGCSKGDPDCSTVLLVFTAVLIGMDGVLQAGGLGMALEAAFLPTSTARAANTKSRAKNAPTIRPVPYVAGRDTLGLGVVGTF